MKGVARIVQGGDRRERLVEAAARLFARWGFDKTSVDDIARKARVKAARALLIAMVKKTRAALSSGEAQHGAE